MTGPPWFTDLATQFLSSPAAADGGAGYSALQTLGRWLTASRINTESEFLQDNGHAWETRFDAAHGRMNAHRLKNVGVTAEVFIAWYRERAGLPSPSATDEDESENIVQAPPHGARRRMGRPPLMLPS